MIFGKLFLIFPMVFVAFSAVMDLLVLINQNYHSVALKNIHFIKLNTSNLLDTSNTTALSQTLGTLVTGGIADTLEQYLSIGGSELATLEEQLQTAMGLPAWYSIDNTTVSITLPSKVQTGMKFVKNAMYAMKAMYVLAILFFVLTILSVLIACVPFFGPLFYSVFSFFGTLFMLVASIIAAAMFRIIAQLIRKEISPLNMPVALGSRVYAYSFLSVASGVVAIILFGITGMCP
ncbi:SUR7 family protein [Schizosaccharomyces japonicus yFS275]|uniref:SUR7 family protein n=1 Tax=Schizosaccharomyces japonicus (strain yFS275 / FY16936) TaxID=402676 RepID=B6K7B2_SCHJY|nr:SUR7 family protein [Schizosaccharomyces japonicus yFS275]EEB09416.1 SUR7 family protein [Schizosaccharomyces japonicus yFS275]